MSHKQSRQSKPHHRPHRRSYQPLPSKSPHRRRGRSQSKPSRRARSSSVRLHSRAVTPARFHSRSRSRPRRAVRARDIPFYVPPIGQHAHDIPNIIADALRKQDEEHNEALTATNLGYRPLTPPPDTNVQGAAMAPAPAPVPGLKRRPSSSPAAAHARRPRRRRPRPRTQSVISDGDSPIPPPRPQPAPTKGEKEKRDKEVKKKREKREVRRKKQETPETIQNQDGDEKINSPKRAKGTGAKESSKPPSQRASWVPPLYQDPVQEGLPQDELSSGSQRGYHPPSKHGRQRHKKHHRRLGEQHHRRKKKRSKYGMRDFFASLRRKLGNLLRLTLPASSAAQSAPPRVDISNPMPARDLPEQGEETSRVGAAAAVLHARREITGRVVAFQAIAASKQKTLHCDGRVSSGFRRAKPTHTNRGVPQRGPDGSRGRNTTTFLSHGLGNLHHRAEIHGSLPVRAKRPVYYRQRPRAEKTELAQPQITHGRIEARNAPFIPTQKPLCLATAGFIPGFIPGFTIPRFAPSPGPGPGPIVPRLRIGGIVRHACERGQPRQRDARAHILARLQLTKTVHLDARQHGVEFRSAAALRRLMIRATEDEEKQCL
ncbi:hypothetical protein GQX73_g662 [Xylaria multiplex]|uniref:Uncharacterized protein n=1 Tax=Xylaria multiplex TaxID=323545 RepID=A0A7C8N4G6_9PEZI|nr:hypothetical protein GQX73_g662 [Xylaria multiplex]